MCGIQVSVNWYLFQNDCARYPTGCLLFVWCNKDLQLGSAVFAAQALFLTVIQ